MPAGGIFAVRDVRPSASGLTATGRDGDEVRALASATGPRTRIFALR